MGIEDYMKKCKLTPLEMHVIRLLNAIPYGRMTLGDIGLIFKISRERVRQLEVKVLKCIKVQRENLVQLRQGA
jgi:DNA-directed RNA polymerase sigma subunit (sigma70/sigma32)